MEVASTMGNWRDVWNNDAPFSSLRYLVPVLGILGEETSDDSSDDKWGSD